MPQKEYSPRDYKQVPTKDSQVHLSSKAKNNESFDFTFEPIRKNLFRVTFTSPGHPTPPFPSVTKPPTDLANVKVAVKDTAPTAKILEVGDITASIDWSHTPVITLSWTGDEVKPGSGQKALYKDLPLRSYVADGTGIAHYTEHDREALHVGLGEKRAPMDLSGRNFQLSATDSFGYDVYNTDPLYKHIPLLIKATPNGCVAIFSTTHGRGSWSVGSEIDGLWGHFKVYRQDYGGLEQYLLVGKTLKDVVHSYAELVGFPLLVPRWAYGYISGGYKYTMLDDPPAHEALIDFAEKLKKHDIPCSAHQMSSGYSISQTEPKVRNVFTWNRYRFPDPEKWIAKYHGYGIRLLTNIKPFLLQSHPDFERLTEEGSFFKDSDTKEPGYMRLWSAGGATGGDGCHIDFTSDFGFRWWYNGVLSLKRAGVDGMWNDNNEYTLPNDDWEHALDHPAVLDAAQKHPNAVGLWGRALHTELMGKASHDALLELEPKYRPFVLTRSATAGPQPSPELLLRWVQLGTHSPRFAINCFKTSPTNNQVGEVIEPWMYPEITPNIRAAIKRRYEILPYIYSLGLESHFTASPPQRWIGWGYESDPEIWSQKLKDGEEQFWLGDSLLVGGVYEAGVDVARVYLPRKQEDGEFDYGYVNLNEPYTYLAAGQWVDISSHWKTSIPLLARIGGAIPVGKDVQTRVPGDDTDASLAVQEVDDYRGVEIFPPKGSSHGRMFVNSWFEDDGISKETRTSKYTVRYSSTEEKVVVGFERDEKGFVPAWRDLDVILHYGDERRVDSDDGSVVEYKGKDGRGRVVYILKT
ncbi:putative alpha-glucosidase [Aspergillus chevalieri]|uniref:alpha-glucosidase n=1 Tax=Aspergillus chevalieri TaxID=182096 RepID=A0A7R7VG55_ASPCH|nr:uncharacterized protein ACHE_11109A [Aspergillus chevalieri]BCR83707.1 hypothetical protein ACHE_11109A [Aspergillus chevalieri]